MRPAGVRAQTNRRSGSRLDRAAAGLTPEKMAAKFPDQPLVQACLLATIGESYRGVGEYAKATDHLRRAHDLFAAPTRPRPPGDPELLAHIGNAYNGAGRNGEAIRLLEQVRDARYADAPPRRPVHPCRPQQPRRCVPRRREVPGGDPAVRAGAGRAGREVRPRPPGYPPDPQQPCTDVPRRREVPGPVRLLERVRDVAVRTLGPDDPYTLLVGSNLPRRTRTPGGSRTRSGCSSRCGTWWWRSSAPRTRTP